MKYMLLVAGPTPGVAGTFDERLIRAGVLLASERLDTSAEGARVEYSGASRTVIDGPFDGNTSATGFWILQVASRDEAIEWARRAPLPSGRIELRRVLDSDDPDVVAPRTVALAPQARLSD